MDLARVVILVVAVMLLVGALGALVGVVSSGASSAQAFYHAPLLEEYGYSDGEIAEYLEDLSALLSPIRAGLLGLGAVFALVLIVRVVQWVAG